MKLWLWALAGLFPCLLTAMVMWSHGHPWLAVATALMPFLALRWERKAPTEEEARP